MGVEDVELGRVGVGPEDLENVLERLDEGNVDNYANEVTERLEAPLERGGDAELPSEDRNRSSDKRLSELVGICA